MEMNSTSLRSHIVITIQSIPRFSLLFIVANPLLVPFPPVLYKALPVIFRPFPASSGMRCALLWDSVRSMQPPSLEAEPLPRLCFFFWNHDSRETSFAVGFEARGKLTRMAEANRTRWN